MRNRGICSLLDKYRDGELDAARRSSFEDHLAACDKCRAAMSLLNNVVHLIRNEEVRPLDLAAQIAREAVRREHSWDYEVVSWLRPGPALAALTLTLVLFSSLWIISGNQQVTAYSEYEKLMDEVDAGNLGSRVSQVRSDNELVTWLEQEGRNSD